MRCALSFDEHIALADQKIRAWGEMQSLAEEPCYREEDIKKKSDRRWLHAYKCAFDDVCNILESLHDDKLIKNKHIEAIEALMAGELCMQLFSILDNQEE